MKDEIESDESRMNAGYAKVCIVGSIILVIGDMFLHNMLAGF